MFRRALVLSCSSIFFLCPALAQAQTITWTDTIQTDFYDCQNYQRTEIVVRGNVMLVHPEDSDLTASPRTIRVLCDNITFEEGAVLQSASGLDIRISQVASGHIQILGTRGKKGVKGNTPEDALVPRKMQNGPQGSPGGNGKSARCRFRGLKFVSEGSSRGGTGARGQDGVSGLLFAAPKGASGGKGVSAAPIVFITRLWGSDTDITIDAVGGDGGDGDRGGHGANGGDGGKGGDGIAAQFQRGKTAARFIQDIRAHGCGFDGARVKIQRLLNLPPPTQRHGGQMIGACIFQIPRKPQHRARRIDTKLAPPLGNMFKEDRSETEFGRIMRHLAERNLRRSHRLNIPSGQACLAAINAFDAAAGCQVDTLVPLSRSELNAGIAGCALDNASMLDATPLWFYCLKEAELSQGDTLGPLGSRIVAETLIGLIVADPLSYWHMTGQNGRWSPVDSRVNGTAILDLPALLRVSGLLA